MASDSNTQTFSYNIRPVNLADAEQLIQNIWLNRSKEDSKNYLNRVIKLAMRKRGIGIIAESNSNQKIVGYSLLSHLTKCYEISDVIVAKSHRGRGVGTAMIQFLIHQVDKTSSLPIEIGVAETNTKALALYQQLGFVKQYELLLDVGQGEERILYLRLKQD